MIKKLQNNFTTPEQSKRLLELGVPEDSADCHYTALQSMVWVHIDNDPDFTNKLITPCWSVGRLIEIYATCKNNFDFGLFRFGKGINSMDYMLTLFEECILDLDFSKLEE